jgi:8-oxo-dGTP pyrophosphatase MutT (NUDIX family)
MLSADRVSCKYVERFAAVESNCALAIDNALGHPRAMRRDRLRLVRSAVDHGPAIQGEVEPRQQVAAICFRILSTGVEFLLVRTRRGRWTFPKGGLQSGLTHAQSAAMEAYEEAGVHGRIEELAFVRYKLRKGQQTIERHVVVHAHLCEVLRLDAPQELNRDPTWFSLTKAKRRLGEGRSQENRAELARVVDRAATRIRRLPTRNALARDPLFTVRFEASELDVQSLRKHAALVASFTSGSGAPPNDRSARVLRNSGAKVLQLQASLPKRSAE